jgi:hypothetical protein
VVAELRPDEAHEPQVRAARDLRAGEAALRREVQQRGPPVGEEQLQRRRLQQVPPPVHLAQLRHRPLPLLGRRAPVRRRRRSPAPVSAARMTDPAGANEPDFHAR